MNRVKWQYLDLYIGIALLFFIASIYSMFLSSITSSYHPIWSDEIFYFVNSHGFFQNNVLNASFTYSGKGSILFGADAHGPAYPLLNGIFAHVAGYSNLNFIQLNFVFAVLSIVLIFSLKSISANLKIWLTCYFLLFPFLPLYAFTYMQESLHIFFAVCLSLLLYQINHKVSDKKYLIAYVALVFLAGLFRNLWFFWLIGLIPFAKNKSQRINFSLLFILGVMCAFCSNYLFTESVPNFFNTATAMLIQGNLLSFLKAIISNFTQNIINLLLNYNSSFVYYAIKLIIILSFFYVAFKAMKGKNQIFIALLLIGLINFALLLLLYEANYWKEIRMMSPLFYCYILFIIPDISALVKYIGVASLIIIFGLTSKLSKQWIAERNNKAPTEIKVISELHKIQQYVPENKTILVKYLPNNELNYLLYLPLKNKNHRPIKYIIPFYQVNEITYDYALNKPHAESSDSVIFKNNFFSFNKTN